MKLQYPAAPLLFIEALGKFNVLLMRAFIN